MEDKLTWAMEHVASSESEMRNATSRKETSDLQNPETERKLVSSEEKKL